MVTHDDEEGRGQRLRELGFKPRELLGLLVRGERKVGMFDAVGRDNDVAVESDEGNDGVFGGELDGVPE